MPERELLVILTRASVTACALLMAGCGPTPEPLDPWQRTSLSEAAGRCDAKAMEEHLAALRRHGQAPNLYDLHHPGGAVARFAEGCSGGLHGPVVGEPDAEILRAMLELAGQETASESAEGQLLLARIDSTRIVLPATRTRSAVPARAAIVSVVESGLIRVSSGEELTVAVAGPEDVLSFAASLVAHAERPVSDGERPSDEEFALPIAIGSGDEVRLGAREIAPDEDLGAALGPMLSLLARSGGRVALEADPAATYGRVVALLDALVGEESPTTMLVRTEWGTGLALESPSGSAAPPVVAIKADRGVASSTVARVLNALAQAHIERVVLLSSLAFEPPEGPPPGTHPGGLPGGLDLRLRRLRPERPRQFPEAIVEPPAIVEPSPVAAVFDRPTAAPPTGFRGPLMVGGDVLAPVKVHAPPAEYTEIARRAEVEGVVILQVVIDERGDVTDVKVLTGLPMGLDAQAIEAVRQWKFEPATRNGEPVEVYYHLTVEFVLE